jgi:Integrase
MLRDLGFHAIERAAMTRGGRFGWVATTKMRWGLFSNFCCDQNINSISEIDREIVNKYARDRCAHLAISTAQNYISAINSVLKILKLDWIPLSPRLIIGKPRSLVRSRSISFSEDDIRYSIEELISCNFPELAGLVLLSANFGLRRREASLLDLPNAIKEAKAKGFIDVYAGTKGGRGRKVERLIPCEMNHIEVLKIVQLMAEDGRCLVSVSKNLKSFYSHISNNCLPILQKNGIQRLHELRVFYACNRYKEITGFKPPCNRNNEEPLAQSELDEKARAIISKELGHSRIDVIGAYVGRKIRRYDRG